MRAVRKRGENYLVANLLKPLRKVVKEYVDRDGAMQVLECGHHVAAKPRVTSRRCRTCTPVEGPAIVPAGPVALRLWMVEHYGWPDRSIKNISKLKCWTIDRIEQERGTIYASDCRLSVEILDDYSLLLRIGNRDIEARLGPFLSTIPQVNGGILVSVAAPTPLNRLADQIQLLTSVPYDIPSFKYVCPRTAARLREFALELGTYTGPVKPDTTPKDPRAM